MVIRFINMEQKSDLFGDCPCFHPEGLITSVPVGCLRRIHCKWKEYVAQYVIYCNIKQFSHMYSNLVYHVSLFLNKNPVTFPK
jgi:hypothetical protein